MGDAVSSASRKKKGDMDDLDGLDDLLTEVQGAFDDTHESNRGEKRHGLVENFHCVACDFSVLRIEDCSWTREAEYILFRNYYPDVKRLGALLEKSQGQMAYCCQCSWRTCPNT